MSYFDYLSCNRELPTGSFGKPPKAVYPSYRAYKASPDYTVPRDMVTGSPLKYDADRITARLKGNVIVYETFQDYHGVSIQPFESDGTGSGTRELWEVVRPQFSLPYLYLVSFDRTAKLEEYLCKYLQPGDKAELFTCWAGDEGKERDHSQDRIIDLQWVLDNNGRTDEQNVSKEGFTLYLAPKAPASEIDMQPRKNPACAFEIIQESGHEACNVHMICAQGLK